MKMFTFGEYALREAQAQDMSLARAWTAADPDHAGRVLPEFWLENGWLLSDREGPVFFFRGIRLGLGRALEIHIQFAPDLARKRLSAALIEGMAWLEANVTEDTDEIRFDSKNFSLIRFCEKRLGFTNAGGMLTKKLATRCETLPSGG